MNVLFNMEINVWFLSIDQIQTAEEGDKLCEWGFSAGEFVLWVNMAECSVLF